MKGDFSRIPFSSSENVSRVLFQQGKPFVEADLNEALSALLANQRKILSRIRAASNKDHGAIGSGFEASKSDSSFAIARGDYQFEDLLFSNPQDAVAKSYTSFNGDQWIVHFDGEPSTPDPIKNESFVIGLVATERPMLISEMVNRASQVGYLRSGIPWIVDWNIFLQPATADPVNVKNAIIGLNKIPTGEPLDITVSFKPKLSSEFDNRLWRIEVHDVDKNSTEVELKLAIDNASKVFRANKSTNVQLERFNAELPRKGEQVEAESSGSWLQPPGVLHEITQLTEHRDGIIAGSEAIADEISANNTDQVRVWQSKAKIEVAKLLVTTDGAEFKLPPGRQGDKYTVTVHVNVADPNDPNAASNALELIRLRDGWTFRSDQVASPEQLAKTNFSPTLISGTRQPVFYAALGTVTFDGNGNVSGNIGNTDFRPIVVAGLAEPALNLVRSYDSKHGSNPTRVGDDSVAASISCHRLFPELENVGVQRWLASTTLGEIAHLSKDDLRSRIEADCDSNDIASTLDSDLDLIVAKRHHLLTTTTFS
ncbi:hypothetical protein RMSM_05398 [Rhodopirellula maiorica SM1]|uniref:Uncharacterized protein n=1 Tax=Rhodopirellula maiorica SM1 TaxID=1265738 RepID=M5RQL1_9BACT|nr:hypothetical protein [Rhodopirellula maiorica]EMI17672.1 hypothetical protein RMSM_05398 [Rhodopirellula maiorica SM1]